jgi:hypothetical protein
MPRASTLIPTLSSSTNLSWQERLLDRESRRLAEQETEMFELH